MDQKKVALKPVSNTAERQLLHDSLKTLSKNDQKAGGGEVQPQKVLLGMFPIAEDQ